MFSRTMTIPHWFSPITRVFIVAVAIFGLSEFARAQTIVVEIQGFVTRSDWDGINTGDVVEVKYTIPYPLVNSYGPQGGNQAKSFGYNTASMSLTMGALDFYRHFEPGAALPCRLFPERERTQLQHRRWRIQRPDI